MAGQFFERQKISARLNLVAIQALRQQHAEQPGIVQLAQQRLGDAPGPLDGIGGRSQRRRHFAGAGQRIDLGRMVHATPVGLLGSHYANAGTGPQHQPIPPKRSWGIGDRNTLTLIAVIVLAAREEIHGR